MLKTIKKSLLLSLFTYSFIFPMRQIAPVMLARTLNQTASFHNSLATRCPFIASVVMAHMAEEAAQIEANAMAANESVNEPIAKSRQDTTATNNQLLSDLNKGEAIKNTQWYAESHPEPVATDWQHKPTGMSHSQSLSNNAVEAREHLSAIAFRVKLDQIEKARFINAKSQVFSCIAEFPATVQNKANELMKPCSSLSYPETIALKQNLTKDQPAFENELLSRSRQNPKTYFVRDMTPRGWNSESMINPYRDLDTCTTKDCNDISMAVELKSEIEAIKAAAKECDMIIHRFEQEARDFAHKLEHASFDAIEKEIMPDLMAKKEAINVAVAGKENELNHHNNDLKAIDDKLELFSKRSLMAKIKEYFKPDYTKELLMHSQKPVKVKQKNTSEQLQPLYDKQKEYSVQIEHVQKIADGKKTN